MRLSNLSWIPFLLFSHCTSFHTQRINFEVKENDFNWFIHKELKKKFAFAKPPRKFATEHNALKNRVSSAEMQSLEEHSHIKSTSIAIKERVKAIYKKAELSMRRGDIAQARSLLYQCVDFDPSDGHSWLKLARLEQNSRNFHTARQIFEESVVNCPNNVHLWQAWAVLESKYGTAEKARELFAKALEVEAANAYVCHAWGLLEQKEGFMERARELYKLSLSSRPQAQVCVALGELEASQGNLEEARTVFDSGVKTITQDLPELLMGWARFEEKMCRDSSKARTLLRKALQLAPFETKVHMAIAQLEARAGNATAVREVLEGAHNLDHRDGTMYNMWANFEAKLGNIRNAIDILNQARVRLPMDQTLPQAQGILEEKLGQHEHARELYKESIQIRPNAPAYLAWGRMESRSKGKPETLEKARQLYELGIKADPSHGPLYNSYAMMEMVSGNISLAKSLLHKGLQASRDARGSVWHGLGVVALKDNDPAQARDCFRKGIEELKVGEDVSHLYHSLGMLELNSHRLSEALEVFGEGIQRYPLNSQLLLGVALAHVRLGCNEEARLFFRKAVKADQKHAHAWQAWGVLETKLGNLQVASTLYDQGLRAAPEHGALWQAYGLLVMQELKDYKRARNLFEEGLKRCPDHIHLYQALTCLEVKEGNLNRARELIKIAITKEPTHGACWTAFAVVEEKAGSIEKAREVYKQGLRYAASHGPLYRSYALLEIKQKNYIRGRNILEAGMKADPHCAPLYHSLAELEGLLGNIVGLNALNKKAQELFDVSIPDRTKEEYFKRISNLEKSLLNYDDEREESIL